MSKIDVSKCEFYYTVSGQPMCIIGANDTRYDDECMENPNCYYKQLQQYKQLCEQKTVDNFDLMSQIDSFKQKLKEIKTISNTYKGIKEMDEITRIINRRK